MCKALYTKHTLNWFPRFSLLVCPAGRAKLECNTADRVSRGFARYVFLVYVMHQSIPAAPRPPRATVGRLPTLSVPEVGHLQILLCPGARHLPTPGLFPSFWHAHGFLSEYNYTEDFTENDKHIGSSVKERKKLKRVVKACSRFYACIFSLLIKPESHGEIASYHDVNQRCLVKPKLNRISVDIIWRTSFHIYKTIRHNI